MVNLCRPTPDLSCFRCCPPIRPSGYDHLDHKPEITRQLIENTADFRAGRLGGAIVGFSCWGLGFIDAGRKLVGCLLHPALNREDLRSLTGYRDKCEREVCPQHSLFSRLNKPVRQTLLEPLSGMDSFSFSSPGANPLWNLLLWGPEVLTPIHSDLGPQSPVFSYLASHPEPRSRARLLSGLLARLAASGRCRRILEPGFGSWFEAAAERICLEIGSGLDPEPAGGSFVHLLGLDRPLAGFIRFGLKRTKMDREEALKTAARVEQTLDRLAGAVMCDNRDFG